MISRYFVLAEFIGWLGLALFGINLLIYIIFYIWIVSQKKKTVSIIWFEINTLLIMVNLMLIILFLVCLINPQSISGQGKLDQFTAEAFISISITLFIFSAFVLIYAVVCQCYWGSWIKDKKLWISFISYDKKDFVISRKVIHFGKRKSKKKIVVKKSAVGKSILEYLKK